MIQSLTLGPLPTDVQQQHERWGGWRWKQQLEGATVGIVRGTAQRILQHAACQQEHDAKRAGDTARTSDPTGVLTHSFFFSQICTMGLEMLLGLHFVCSSGTALHSQCKLHIHLHSGTEGENRIRDGAVVLAPRAKCKWLP